MPRTKNRPGTAHSAAHAATDPAPAPGAAPAAGSPAAAVHAALAANPGTAVTAIANAAGISKPAARAALLAMEKAGIATRVKGTTPGIPDTWTLAEPAPDGTGPAADPQAGQPGEDPGSPDGAGGPAPHDGDADAGTSAAPGPQTAEPEPHDTPAEDGHEDAVPGADDEAAPGGPDNEAAPADAGGETCDAPDPALLTDLTGRLAQIKAAADAAATALTGDTDLRAALAGLDEIYEQATAARRSLKTATGGTKAPAVRPGGLRDKVLAHLDAHPGKDFTPHEIHKVLGHSSGAIANALDTLVKLGDAEVATEKPRRFRRATQPAEAAPGADGAHSAGQDGTGLAGAA